MIRGPSLLALVLLTAGTLTIAVPEARSAEGALVLDEAPLPVLLRLHPPQPEERQDAMLEIRRWQAGREGAELQRMRLPDFLFRDASPTLEARWHPVRGGAPLLQIVVDAGADEIDIRSWESWLLPPGAPGNPGRNLRQIWSGRHSGLDHGEGIRIGDFRGTGRDQIVVSFSHPLIRWCGRDDVLLSPRAFDAREGVFRPVAIPLRAGEAAAAMERSDAPLPDRLGEEVRADWVSSRAETGLHPSHGRAPTALRDGAADTGWHIGGPGGGEGQFLRGQVVDGLSLAGLTIRTGIEGEARGPATLLIGLEDGREFLLSPESGVRETWLFPEPVPTGCVSVGVVEGAEGAAIGIAELHFHTHADLVPLREAILDIVLPLFEAALGTLEERRLGALLSSTGPEGLDILMEVIADAEPRLQAALVAPIAGIEGGAGALTRWMARGEAGRAAVREYGRRVGVQREEVTTILIAELFAAETEEAIGDVLRVLSRSADPERVMVLAPMLGSPQSGHRIAAREGLLRTPPPRLEPLVEQAWLGNVEIATQTLLALHNIGMSPERARPAPLEEPGITQLRELTEHENGTVARLAIASIGALRVHALRDVIDTLATSDPHPYLRAEALQALVRMDERRVWIPQAQWSDARTRAATETRLVAALSDAEPIVRLRAARLLIAHEVARDEHLPAIADRLEREQWPDILRALHRVAVDACDAAIDARVVAHLEGRPRSEVRAALRAFQSRPCAISGAHIRRLDEVSEGDESILLSLAQLAARSGDTEAGTWIVERLQDPSTGEYALRALLEAVGRKRIDDALPLLERWVTDADPVLRRAAVRAWAFQDNAEALARMQRALEAEPDPRVRETIRRVIRSIEDNIELRESMHRAR